MMGALFIGTEVPPDIYISYVNSKAIISSKISKIKEQ